MSVSMPNMNNIFMIIRRVIVGHARLRNKRKKSLNERMENSMKQKFGIRKTKMNIFWLLVVGLVIGVVVGLRQPMPNQAIPVPNAQPMVEATQK